ncbi:methyltransferase type 12 [Roseibium sp. TrichSKD4]|uniref:class I SAM-dependent methyltransferase n=1 Tax=Roseibium sp. TrichSKD4 TaxID=744980 RepID=UPI0001E576C6|nr:class I SAM-dependent methyltransferase [Roseibium sp. TrichSKD4]EFO30083.1 methyltransferase type 12 [Roseibium sp. TrichSKD4]
MKSNIDVEAGFAIYSPKSLKLYDLVVHGASNRFLWRCPTEKLVELHTPNVSNVHLDIGVATGIFMDRARWPSSKPNITLMDPNLHCLQAAQERIARYAPNIAQADVFQPLPFGTKFRSVSLCYLLHCLPGAMKDKAPVVFENIAGVMECEAKIFGATLVQGDAPRNAAARYLMSIYNEKGVFSNTNDTYEDLERALLNRFSDVRLERYGCAVLFEAQNT